jgi:anti-anti-sigma regulatory factor
MLRIDKNYDGQNIILRLSGRIHSADIPALQEQVGQLGRPLIFDLRELQLVDESAVEFLATCEKNGVILRHGAAYINEWIRRIRAPD